MFVVEFVRRQRFLSLVLFSTLLVLLVAKIIWPRYLAAQSSQPATSNQPASTGPVPADGSKVGNNIAVQFNHPSAVGDSQEAPSYFLALVEGIDKGQTIADVINAANGTVIVRHGAGKGTGPTADGYAKLLIEAAAGTNKKFIAQISRNEANCAEHETLSDELTWARTVVGKIKSDAKASAQITLITGQIDFFCGDASLGSPDQYLNGLQSIPGVTGVSLPLYTGVAGGAAETTAAFNAFAGKTTKDIYITEAGPLRGAFADFVTSLQAATVNPKVKGVLLYNSHHRNPQSDTAFAFTKPFWNPACRQVLRDDLGNTEKVLSICGENALVSTYFEYNLQRASSAKILDNFYDEYSVSCLPKEEYQLVKKNEDYCPFITSGRGCHWNVTGELTVNPSGKLFGLLRNEEESEKRTSANTGLVPDRLESIEGYLGSRNDNADASRDPGEITTALPKVTDVSLAQSPLYKLTSLQDQCEFAVKKLIAVQELCADENRIEGEVEELKKTQASADNVSTCSLDTIIPGTTNTTHASLYRQIGSPDLESVSTTCRNLLQVKENDAVGQATRKAILNVPPTMETAYRPAFIVAITRFQGLGEKNNGQKNVVTESQDLKPENQQQGEYYVVDYLEVKVPAFGSDFISPNSPKSNEKNNAKRNTYRDPLRMTADLITSLATQKFFQRKQDKERQAIREKRPEYQKTKVLEDIRGEIVGREGENILCYQRGSDGKYTNLVPCPIVSGEKYDKNADALPSALTAFINDALKIQNGGFSCNGNEPDFYDEDNKKMVAEQVRKLGTKLDTKNVGVLEKKKDLKVGLSVDIKDISKDGDNITSTTELYFVSPHNYNIEYARQAFMNFVSKEQRDKVLALYGSSGDQGGTKIAPPRAQLDPEQFSPLLKTGSGDQFSNTAINEEADLGKSSGNTAPGTATPTNPQSTPTSNKMTVSVGIEQPKDDKGNPKPHSLFWRYVGQVASLPTRLMALVTTPINSAVNEYTQGCTGSYATEDWLTGKCKEKVADREPQVCAGKAVTICANSESTCKVCEEGDPVCVAASRQDQKDNGIGTVATISDGVIELALKVSAETCMPAEVLIGILAKESNGETYSRYPYTGTKADDNPGEPDVLTGDINQLVIDTGKQMRCQQLIPGDSNSPMYLFSCGAYQYAQFGLESQINTYGAAIKPCLDSLGLNDTPDTRKLGYAMCVAAADAWRDTYISKNGYRFSYRSTTFGCGGDIPGAIPKKAYTIDELYSLGYSQENINQGILGFHGDSENTDGALGNYLQFINQYKERVSKVREDLKQCKPMQI